MKILFTSLWLILMVTSGRSINCYDGAEIYHTFTKADSRETIACSSSETYCLRMESSGTQFGFRANVTSMICATKETCENPSCYQLANRSIETAADGYPAPLHDHTSDVGGAPDPLYHLQSCDVVCCQEDNCNGNSISYIRHSVTTIRPTTLSTTKIRATPKTRGERLQDPSKLFAASVESPTEKTSSQKTVAAEMETATQGASVTAVERFLLVLSLSVSMLLLLVFS